MGRLISSSITIDIISGIDLIPSAANQSAMKQFRSRCLPLHCQTFSLEITNPFVQYTRSRLIVTQIIVQTV